MSQSTVRRDVMTSHRALQHGEKAAWKSSLEGKAIRSRHTGRTVGPMSLLQRRRGARWGDVRRLQGCGSAEHQTGPGLGQKVASLLAAHQAPFKTTRLWDCEQSNFFAKALTLYFFVVDLDIGVIAARSVAPIRSKRNLIVCDRDGCRGYRGEHSQELLSGRERRHKHFAANWLFQPVRGSGRSFASLLRKHQSNKWMNSPVHVCVFSLKSTVCFCTFPGKRSSWRRRGERDKRDSRNRRLVQLLPVTSTRSE